MTEKKVLHHVFRLCPLWKICPEDCRCCGYFHGPANPAKANRRIEWLKPVVIDTLSDLHE